MSSGIRNALNVSAEALGPDSQALGFATDALVIRDDAGERLGTLPEGQIALYVGDAGNNRTNISTVNGLSGNVSSNSFVAFGRSEFVASVSNANSLNVRYGPGTDYAVIGTLLNSESAPVLATAGAWSLIVYNGKVGYTANKYLAADETFPTAELSQTDRVGDVDSPSEITMVVGQTHRVTSTHTSGIEWTSTNSSIATMQGDTVTAKKAGECYMYGTDSAGNMRIFLVKVLASADENPQTSQTGSRSKAVVSTKVDPLPVRSGPGTSYSVVGQLAIGQVVDFSYIEGSSWAIIYNDDGSIMGYATTKYLLEIIG